MNRARITFFAGGLIIVLLLGCKLLRSNKDPVILELGGSRRPAANAINQYWCGAVDPDTDELSFEWHCTRGEFSGEGDQVEWTAPSCSGTDSMSVTVTDGRGGSAIKSISITVVPCTTMIAHWEGTLYARNYSPWSATLDTGFCVQGSFAVDSAVIDFLILDDANFVKWTDGESYLPELEIDSTSGSDVFLEARAAGVYHVILDNRRNSRDRHAHALIFATSP